MSPIATTQFHKILKPSQKHNLCFLLIINIVPLMILNNLQKLDSHNFFIIIVFKFNYQRFVYNVHDGLSFSIFY